MPKTTTSCLQTLPQHQTWLNSLLYYSPLHSMFTSYQIKTTKPPHDNPLAHNPINHLTLDYPKTTRSLHICTPLPLTLYQADGPSFSSKSSGHKPHDPLNCTIDTSSPIFLAVLPHSPFYHTPLTK